MIDQGYAATILLNQLHDVIIEEKLSDKQKSVIAEKMAVSRREDQSDQSVSGSVYSWTLIRLLISISASLLNVYDSVLKSSAISQVTSMKASDTPHLISLILLCTEA